MWAQANFVLSGILPGADIQPGTIFEVSGTDAAPMLKAGAISEIEPDKVPASVVGYAPRVDSAQAAQKVNPEDIKAANEAIAELLACLGLDPVNASAIATDIFAIVTRPSEAQMIAEARRASWELLIPQVERGAE